MSRYALYWAPTEESALWRAGTGWLGRDPGGAVARPGLDLGEIVRDAARYGFHATLKPPMRLREGASPDDLLAAAAEAAAGIPAFELPPLAVAELDGFLCLRETRESAALQALCDAIVAAPDHLRAPPTQDELARRRAGRLAPAQAANLARWGYPYVFATWFFHMTLTRRLSAAEVRALRPAAEAWFAPALVEPVRVDDFCVFVEPEPGAAFRVLARLPLGG